MAVRSTPVAFAAKWGIVRDAVRAYLAKPLYRLPNPSTA